jgi:bifunctional non-homologous end joining protein LigD
MKPRTKSTATGSGSPVMKSRNRKISPASIDGAIKSPMPDFIEPCLATLVAAPPQGDDWVHEIKFDGYRIQARIDGDGVTLITRSGLDWTDRFGTLPLLLRKVHRGTALIDSELVVEDSEGHSSFTELATTLKSGRAQGFVLQCFDLLYLDGFNITQATLTERKILLRQMLGRQTAASQIRYSEHLSGDSTSMLLEACRLGLEGIVSKRADRPYRSGRHDEWLKSKCIQVDEFVIIGYLVSNVSANAVGAIVVGYFDRKRLRYAGRVGTGFTQRTAAELMRILKPLRIADPIVATQLTGLQRKGVTWVKPAVVAQIEYRAWTADNLLRHAAFKGIREDKRATDVRRPVVKSPKP